MELDQQPEDKNKVIEDLRRNVDAALDIAKALERERDTLLHVILTLFKELPKAK